MKHMHNLRFSLVFFSIMSFGHISYAQTPVELLGSVPSPQATDLGRFGDIPMSYYTGRANITVPIHSFTERGVTLDINLTYDTSGLLMNKLPGWVGPGWTLNAGGCITRVQRRFCDEIAFPHHPENNFINYFHAYRDVAPHGVLDSTTVLNENNWRHKDYAPDIFYFNFMGKTGRFFLGNDGEWKVISDDNLVVKFDVLSSSNYIDPVFSRFPTYGIQPKTIKGFVIYDDQGNKYTFGGDTSAIEYSIGLFRMWQQNNEDPWIADCWYLKEVKDRFGNLLFEFSYSRGKYCVQMFRENQTNAPPYTGTLNLPVYLTQIKTLKGEQIDFTTESPYEAGQTARNLYPSLYPNSSPMNIIPSELQEEQNPLYYLQVLNPSTAPFFATNTLINDDPLAAMDIQRLKTISIRHQQTSSANKYAFIYDNNGRYHLSSIEIRSEGYVIGYYTFTYNDFQSIDDDYLSKKHDSGGYFNNNENSLLPNPTYAKKGMMTKITYPTGGYSILDYELNDFSYAMDATRQYIIESLGQAFGLRICGITDYTDENGGTAIRRIIK